MRLSIKVSHQGPYSEEFSRALCGLKILEEKRYCETMCVRGNDVKFDLPPEPTSDAKNDFVNSGEYDRVDHEENNEAQDTEEDRLETEKKDKVELAKRRKRDELQKFRHHKGPRITNVARTFCYRMVAEIDKRNAKLPPTKLRLNPKLRWYVDLIFLEGRIDLSRIAGRGLASSPNRSSLPTPGMSPSVKSTGSGTSHFEWDHKISHASFWTNGVPLFSSR
ncbi:hypothetical protein Tco_1062395 [Tanacetum coccineum]